MEAAFSLETPPNSNHELCLQKVHLVQVWVKFTIKITNPQIPEINCKVIWGKISIMKLSPRLTIHWVLKSLLACFLRLRRVGILENSNDFVKRIRPGSSKIQGIIRHLGCFFGKLLLGATDLHSAVSGRNLHENLLFAYYLRVIYNNTIHIDIIIHCYIYISSYNIPIIRIRSSYSHQKTSPQMNHK